MMNDELRSLLENAFKKVALDDKTYDFVGMSSLFPSDYKEFLWMFNGGHGSIGDNSYLQLWERDKIEEFNNDYEAPEYLNNIVLIGSDGGDTAYGINKNGQFIEVPFIGMDDDEVNIISNSFADFINYLYK